MSNLTSSENTTASTKFLVKNLPVKDTIRKGSTLKKGHPTWKTICLLNKRIVLDINKDSFFFFETRSCHVAQICKSSCFRFLSAGITCMHYHTQQDLLLKAKHIIYFLNRITKLAIWNWQISISTVHIRAYQSSFSLKFK
jgi:hypothetical protein